MNLVIVGSMAFDTIHTPTDTRERVIGGACTYASLAASNFTKPGIIGVIGDDFTDEHLKILKDKGIDTNGVERKPGKSFFWEGTYHENMTTRDTIATELNVFETFDPVIPDDYMEAPYLFLANIDPPLQIQVIDNMKNVRFSIVDTMNLWIDIKKAALTEVFMKVDCVVMNDEEIAQFTGQDDLLKGAEEIKALGPKYVIIKKGANGAAISGPDGFYFESPTFKVDKVVDPTGAGDSFAGAFIGYLALQNTATPMIEDIKKALIYGNAVASYTVEGFSIEALEAIDMSRIEERFEAIQELLKG